MIPPERQAILDGLTDEVLLRAMMHCLPWHDATWADRADFEAMRQVLAEALAGRETPAPTPSRWQPIETAPLDGTRVLVGLIRDEKLWRVSEAGFNGLGWYDQAGSACHWRTRWCPLPAVAALTPRDEDR